MRRSFVFYIIACVCAALVPFLAAQPETHSRAAREVAFAGWPAEFEGKKLTQLPLAEFEQRFATDFPGRIGRFTDGKREIVVRWVTEATRQMHFASDCFQGLGYTVTPLPVHRDGQGSLWASFAAVKGSEHLRVYERIHNDAGESWTDVSAWYWSALRHENGGPWWANTVAEKIK